MIVLVAPGQGSQTPGFLSPWLDIDGARERLEALSDAAGLDLVLHGTESDADTIKDTKVAQPLIVAAGILTLEQLPSAEHFGGIAGHSVGELTAAVGAGILTAEAAMSLVGERGRAMADAAALAPTGMAAVIGADEATLLARLDELGLSPANYNGGGQIVVAGALDALARLREEPPASSRVIPLQTAGAFHTTAMDPAVARMRAKAESTEANDPSLTIWTNHDGTVVTNGRAYLDLLVGQVSRPVRWDLTMEAFHTAGVTGIIELAPAGALVGLAKRGLRGVPSVGIKTPEDIAKAIELIGDAA